MSNPFDPRKISKQPHQIRLKVEDPCKMCCGRKGGKFPRLELSRTTYMEKAFREDEWIIGMN